MRYTHTRTPQFNSYKWPIKLTLNSHETAAPRKVNEMQTSVHRNGGTERSRQVNGCVVDSVGPIHRHIFSRNEQISHEYSVSHNMNHSSFGAKRLPSHIIQLAKHGKVPKSTHDSRRTQRMEQHSRAHTTIIERKCTGTRIASNITKSTEFVVFNDFRNVLHLIFGPRDERPVHRLPMHVLFGYSYDSSVVIIRSRLKHNGKKNEIMREKSTRWAQSDCLQIDSKNDLAPTIFTA